MEPINILIQQFLSIARASVELLPEIFVALTVIILTAGLSKLARSMTQRAFKRTRLRQSLKELFTLLISILIWVLGVMIAAVILFPGLTPASMLAGLGIGSVAIGFAFKDVFENFLAGIIILFRREMRIGDYIECENIEGQVEHIAIRESHIRQTDGQLVIVPNSILFKNPVTVRTSLDTRRVTIICGVAYDVDLDVARNVLQKAVENCKSVAQNNKPVQVFAQDFGDSSINFEVTWWTGSKPVDVRASRDQVVSSVKQALDEANIEIPFPYRTLTFKEPLPIRREMTERSDGE